MRWEPDERAGRSHRGHNSGELTAPASFPSAVRSDVTSARKQVEILTHALEKERAKQRQQEGGGGDSGEGAQEGEGTGPVEVSRQPPPHPRTLGAGVTRCSPPPRLRRGRASGPRRRGCA